MGCHSTISRPIQLSPNFNRAGVPVYVSIRDQKEPIDKKTIERAYYSSPDKSVFIEEVTNLLTKGRQYLIEKLTQKHVLKRQTILEMIELLLLAYLRKAASIRTNREKFEDAKEARFWASFQRTIREIFQSAGEDHDTYGKLIQIAEAMRGKLKNIAWLDEQEINKLLNVEKLRNGIKNHPSPIALSLWLAEKIAGLEEKHPLLKPDCGLNYGPEWLSDWQTCVGIAL